MGTPKSIQQNFHHHRRHHSQSIANLIDQGKIEAANKKHLIQMDKLKMNQ